MAVPLVSSLADIATASSVPVTPFTGTRLRYFGDYELLEEIARAAAWVWFSKPDR